MSELFVEGATRAVSKQSRQQLRRIRERMATGEAVDRAEMEALRTREPDWYAPLLLLATKAVEEGDADAIAYCMAQADATWPDGMRAHYLRAWLSQEAGERKEALRSARLAMQRPAFGQALVVKVLELVWSLGGRSAVRTTPLHETTPGNLPPEALLRLVRIFQACGDAERTQALAQVLVERAPALRADVEAVLSCGGVAERRQDVDWDADFIAIPSPGSDTAIVVFSGIKHEAGVTLEALHEELEPMACHFVALRDMDRLLFMGAHPALGANPVECASRLRARLERMGARRIVLLGNSAGALGALLYGALMKADAVVGYGAITDVQAPFEPRGRSVLRRLRRLAPDWLSPPGDRLEDHDPAMPVLLYFGAGMDIDRMHAERLASQPGVRLRAVPDFAGHNVLQELMARGRMRAELEGFIAPLRLAGAAAAIA